METRAALVHQERFKPHREMISQGPLSQRGNNFKLVPGKKVKAKTVFTKVFKQTRGIAGRITQLVRERSSNSTRHVVLGDTPQDGMRIQMYEVTNSQRREKRSRIREVILNTPRGNTGRNHRVIITRTKTRRHNRGETGKNTRKSPT